MYRILISKDKSEEVYAECQTDNKDEIFCFNLNCIDDTFGCENCIFYNQSPMPVAYSFAELAADNRIALGPVCNNCYKDPSKKLLFLLAQKEQLLKELQEIEEKFENLLLDRIVDLTPEEQEEIKERLKEVNKLK